MEGLQGGDQGHLPTVGGTAPEIRFQPPNPVFGGPDGGSIVVEHHLGGGLLEPQLTEPGLIADRPGPGARRRLPTLAEQELAQPVPGAEQIGLGVIASPHQIAQGFVGHLGDPHRGEIARAQQAGQRHRVPVVRLHPIARPAGDQRGRHHHTLHAQGGELAVQRVARGPGLVGRHQAGGAPQPPDQFAHRAGIVGDGAVESRRAASLADGHRDGGLVRIQTQVASDTFFH